jgi:hypothetical protein
MESFVYPTFKFDIVPGQVKEFSEKDPRYVAYYLEQAKIHELTVIMDASTTVTESVPIATVTESVPIATVVDSVAPVVEEVVKVDLVPQPETPSEELLPEDDMVVSDPIVEEPVEEKSSKRGYRPMPPQRKGK